MFLHTAVLTNSCFPIYVLASGLTIVLLEDLVSGFAGIFRYTLKYEGIFQSILPVF